MYVGHLLLTVTVFVARQRECLIVDVLLLKVASYSGMLSFELQYTLLSDRAQSYFDADVELIVSIDYLRVHIGLFLSVLIMLMMAVFKMKARCSCTHHINCTYLPYMYIIKKVSP